MTNRFSGILITLTLWSIVVSQPLLDFLGRGGEFFVAHHVGAAEIIAWLAVVCLIPPLLLGLLASLHRHAARVVFTLLIALLFLQLLYRAFHLPAPFALALALVAGFFISKELQTPGFIRGAASWGSLLALSLPVWFIFGTPAHGLVFSNGESHSVFGETHTNSTPVVVLILDELPVITLQNKAGGIDADRFPNFGRLAKTSTFYPNTHTVANSTLLAVPAILSGKYPAPDDLPTFTGLPRNLFVLLGNTHKIRALESRTQLCPPSLCSRKDSLSLFFSRVMLLSEDSAYVYLHWLLPEEWKGWLPDISNDWLGFQPGEKADGDEGTTADTDEMSDKEKAKWAQKQKSKALRDKPDVTKDRMALFDQFLASIPPQNAYKEEKPPLFFLHITLPHSRYNYTPACKKYSTDTGIAGMRDKIFWGESERGVLQSQQRHHWQVLCADKLVGRMIDHLKKENWWDESLVIVTADHGVSFRANDGRRMFSDTNIADIMDVPLFIKQPGQASGDINPKSISSIDILPTLSELLDAKPEHWQPDGRSILSGPPRNTNLIFDKSWEKRDYPYDPAAQGEARALRIKRLGTGENYPRMYQIGPHGNWVGKAVSQLPAGAPSSDLGGAFSGASSYGYYLLRGSVKSPHTLSEEHPPELAIAADGILWSAYPYIYAGNDGKSLNFSALLPEEALSKNPKPELTLYVIRNGQLHEIRQRT